MEQTPRTETEEFTERFTCVLSEHWSNILYILSRQSPRIATLLCVSCPTSMQRLNGGWQIRIATRTTQPERLQQPRDNEVVAHAIRSWARSTARLTLPPVTVLFEK